MELIKDDVQGMPEHFKELISTALDCGEVLSNLINNVLDVSKIQAQMFQPVYSKAQPRTILHKVFNVSKTICVRKGLTLILDIDKNLPNFLLLDGTRLTQVLINLVSNAIKFTEEGYIKIKVTWKYEPTNVCKKQKSDLSNYLCVKPRSQYEVNEEENSKEFMFNPMLNSRQADKCTQTQDRARENCKKETYSSLDSNDESFLCYYHEELKGTLLVDVEDSGIGISDDNCKKLFNPFTQANSAISKLYGGTGLGLWISKTIIQVYKGCMSVTSEVNKGSTFRVELPCSVYIFLDNPLPKNSLISQKLEVLLLDNQFTKANKKALEEQGIKVNVCISSYLANKYLDTYSHHFIFISINFLTENSLTLMNRLKRIETEKKTPIIILVPENQIDRIPPKFKSYSALISPLSHQDIGKMVNFLYQKSVQKNAGVVLILDDDRFILDILSKILEKEKILHSTFLRGAELVEVYKKQNKDVALVVVDANLEETTGFEIARLIREFEKGARLNEVPIVCISGDNDEKHMKKCRESGICFSCNSYIVTKPVKREEYINTIKRFLR